MGDPFRLAHRPVTGAEWIAFIEDGGYRTPTLWLSDGWATVEREGWQAPLYWWREDGAWMAFNSNRLGTAHPQIYVMPASGGEADLVSPYLHGQEGYYTSPEWAPMGEYVAFHGRVSRRGWYQILVAEVSDQGRRLRQLTWEGNNEDPSWAPDGRHLVFVGERQWGFGLFVVDVSTGDMRASLSGRRVNHFRYEVVLGQVHPLLVLTFHRHCRPYHLG